LLLAWKHTGFSVHTRVPVEPDDGEAVERLARYIMRPPISLERIIDPTVVDKILRHLRAKEGHRERKPPRDADLPAA